jgi:hypothetical protein
MADSKAAGDLFAKGIVPGPAQYAQPEKIMVNVAEPPFVGHRALEDYSRLSQSIMPEELCTHSDDQYFEGIIKTMEAMKDVIDWTRANLKTLEMTYSTDRYRRELHTRLIREGFRALTRPGGPR